MVMLSAVLGVLVMAAPTPAPKQRSVAVLDIAARGGVDKGKIEMFSDLLQGELRSHGFKVIGRSDIDQLLGLEKLKDTLGCTNASCLAEIGGALGVDELVNGAIARVGGYLVFTLKRIEPKQAQVLKQVVKKMSGTSDSALIDAAPAIAAELYDYAPPAPAAGGSPAIALAPSATVVGGLPELPAALRDGFVKTDLDADLLVAYDTALRADKEGAAHPAEAAAAWNAVVRVKKKNPFLADAKGRAKAWTEFASKKAKLDAQEQTDRAKLEKLLPLASLDLEQKRRLVLDFAKGYGAEKAMTLLAAQAVSNDRADICKAFVGQGVGTKVQVWTYYGHFAPTPQQAREVFPAQAKVYSGTALLGTAPGSVMIPTCLAGSLRLVDDEGAEIVRSPGNFPTGPECYGEFPFKPRHETLTRTFWRDESDESVDLYFTVTEAKLNYVLAKYNGAFWGDGHGTYWSQRDDRVALSGMGVSATGRIAGNKLTLTDMTGRTYVLARRTAAPLTLQSTGAEVMAHLGASGRMLVSCPGGNGGVVHASGPFPEVDAVCTAAHYRGEITSTGGELLFWRVDGINEFSSSAGTANTVTCRPNEPRLDANGNEIPPPNYGAFQVGR